jgi:hypothetical protein
MFIKGSQSAEEIQAIRKEVEMVGRQKLKDIRSNELSRKT